MKKVNNIIRVIQFLVAGASGACITLGYQWSENVYKWVGFGVLALNIVIVFVTELINAYRNAKAAGTDFGLRDFFGVVYDCIPILVGYAESLDKSTGGLVKGNDKANAVLEQLKLVCEEKNVKFYEDQAKAIIEPIIASDKFIQQVQSGDLTIADLTAMMNSIKGTQTMATNKPEVEQLVKMNNELAELVGKKETK